MLRHIFWRLIHYSCIILILKILNCILPCYLTKFYFQAANFLLCIVIAELTLGFSKKLVFREKVQPKGKAILITGCARGFGKQIAQHLDSKGFHVFASCLNPDSPSSHDLRKRCSSRLQVFQLDVRDDVSVEKAAKFVKDNLGSSELWAVINNAGIQKGFLAELTRIQDFQETMEVNAIGQVRVTKAFLPLLRKSRGRVINISSMAGRVGVPGCSAYTMSKHASIGFSASLRYELDIWGIKVISVEPEFFQTDMSAGVLMRIDEALNSADENVRQDYGEEFLKRIKTATGAAMRPSPNIHKLLEDIESAVTLRNPDHLYKTSRNIFVKFLCRFYESWPAEFHIGSMRMVCRILGLPNPGKAK